ncbi:hypothetical protein [Tissierella praeacuta]|uniref:hypothetical protein n=1 Tax=Tissierella praeacuta TaxID=43131 RepID=UPI0033418BC2
MTSIYYQVNRSYPLTKIEQDQITQILKECEASYPYLESGEALCQYSYDLADPTCILSGSAKLPYPYDDMQDQDSLEMQTKALFFLIQWLTTLRRAIPNAEWDASLEDVTLIWEEENGWRLMTNEEYNNLNYK